MPSFRLSDICAVLRAIAARISVAPSEVKETTLNLNNQEKGKINLVVCLFIIYFTAMKQSFTYSGDPKIRKEAMRLAKKEEMKFSVLVESLLKKYIKVEIGDNCDAFQAFLKDQGVEFRPNGSFTTIVDAGKIDLFFLGVTYGEYRQQIKKKI